MPVLLGWSHSQPPQERPGEGSHRVPAEGRKGMRLEGGHREKLQVLGSSTPPKFSLFPELERATETVQTQEKCLLVPSTGCVHKHSLVLSPQTQRGQYYSILETQTQFWRVHTMSDVTLPASGRQEPVTGAPASVFSDNSMPYNHFTDGGPEMGRG